MFLFFILININKKNTTAAGFEPTRVTPSDFESDALTTRPNCQILFLIFLSLNIKLLF